jgi:hypothetical protein
MIIADLNHLEIVSEETTIEGGVLDPQLLALLGVSILTQKPVAASFVTSSSTALGFLSFTNTIKVQEAVPGLYSRSIVQGQAIGIG